jgi:hypothetical protein
VICAFFLLKQITPGASGRHTTSSRTFHLHISTVSHKLTAPQTPEREKAELSQYDAKVYRACKAMTEAQTSSLKVLGVPFFGTKPHLIIFESSEPSSATDTEQKSGNQKISKGQLLNLQRKMLNHLMELYGD